MLAVFCYLTLLMITSPIESIKLELPRMTSFEPRLLFHPAFATEKSSQKEAAAGGGGGEGGEQPTVAVSFAGLPDSFANILFISEGRPAKWNATCYAAPVGCLNQTIILAVAEGPYLLQKRQLTLTINNQAVGCEVDTERGVACPPSLEPLGLTVFGLPLPGNHTGQNVTAYQDVTVPVGQVATVTWELEANRNYTLTVRAPRPQLGTHLEWWRASLAIRIESRVSGVGIAIFSLLGVFVVAVLVLAFTFRAHARTMLAQYRVMMWKNWVLARRNWGLSLLQVVPAIAFVLFLLILAVVPHFTNPVFPNPKVQNVGGIPRCIPTPDVAHPWCISLAYVPAGDPLVETLMRTVANASQLPLYSSLQPNIPSGAIIGFDNAENLTAYVLAQKNRTQAAVVFTELQAGTEKSPPRVAYQIWYNNSYFQDFAKLTVRYPDIRVPVQTNVDSAIFQNLFANSNSSITVLTKRFPEVTLTDFLSDPVRIYGGLFFFCGSLFPFVVLMYQLSFEKDNKLKLGMMMMGLRGSVYWFSWFTTAVIFNMLTTLCLIAFGSAAQFAYFLKTDFWVLFVVFFTFQVTMTVLAIFISVFINSVKQSISISMLLFIIGALIQMFCTSPYFIALIYDTSINLTTPFRWILSFYPPFQFAKIFYDISLRSFSVGPLQGPGYQWADLYNPAPLSFEGIELPPTAANLYWLMLDAVIFLILAWYFETVTTSGTGTAEKPWFLFTAKWWGCRRSAGHSEYEIIGQDSASAQYNGASLNTKSADIVDEDVDKERERTLGNADDESVAVRICNLVKTYHKYPFGIRSKGDVHAVRGVAYSIPKNTVFCLLGHNGSGKSTTIGMLTGLIEPSSGDAFVFGQSVRAEPQMVRRTIGVCPQHDILWPDLTAAEHLEIFARLKGFEPHEIPPMIEETLEGVALLNVQHHRCKTYSGGMKRRLSVAVSSIGNPQLIIMDEPTTGMDPKSVQHVWQMIQYLKKDRSILLTTHSMEEAEILADRIAIMNQGLIMCIGTSLHLKNKFGDGYRLTLSTRHENTSAVRGFVSQQLPSARLVSKKGEILTFSLPFQPEESASIVTFLRQLEAYIATNPGLVTDWGVSMPTLEAVFNSVTTNPYH